MLPRFVASLSRRAAKRPFPAVGLNVAEGWKAAIRSSRLNVASAPILLKNSDNERRQKTRLWSSGPIAPRVAITNSLRSPHKEKLAFLPNPKRFLLKARLLPQEL